MKIYRAHATAEYEDGTITAIDTYNAEPDKTIQAIAEQEEKRGFRAYAPTIEALDATEANLKKLNGQIYIKI